jgi:hypothetical protein
MFTTAFCRRSAISATEAGPDDAGRDQQDGGKQAGTPPGLAKALAVTDEPGGAEIFHRHSLQFSRSIVAAPGCARKR